MLTVCRLCLAKEPNFIIFNQQVSMRILTCTGLEVESNDGLPELICNSCRLRLEEFYHFRKRCHGADRRLRAAKRLENNPDCQTICLLEGDMDDAINLQDVAECKGAACSESNAHWRKEAAKLIRTEIDAYKKELLSLCKQQVREEIEQQVRSEVEDLILAQARKECRLNVLDGLFYEIESFFVRKRNAIVCEQAFGSESDAAELESVSSIVAQNVNNCEPDQTLTEDYTNLDPAHSEVVVVADDEPVPPTPETSEPMNQEPLALPAPVPMVEINMQNVQPSLMRDDFCLPKLAVTTPTKLKSENLQSQLQKSGKPKKPLSKKLSICRKHSLRQKQRDSYKYTEDANCYRCRLKGLHSLNKTVS